MKKKYNMLHLDEFSRKRAQRQIIELKNILSYLKINYGGLTLNDISFKLESAEFIPLFTNIIDNKKRRK